MSGNYLAVDIGTSSIKAVEKAANGEILRWGMLERRSKPFHSTIHPLEVNDAAKYLRVLIDKMRADGPFQSANAVASVPPFAAFSAFAPEPDPRFIPAAAGTFQLASIKLRDDWHFLYAAPHDVVEKYSKILDLAGFDLRKLELENVALAKSLAGVNERVLLVDFGHRSTSFTVVENGLPIFVDQTDFATASANKDVIMNKTEIIAANWQVRRVITSGGEKGAFDVVSGL